MCSARNLAARLIVESSAAFTNFRESRHDDKGGERKINSNFVPSPASDVDAVVMVLCVVFAVIAEVFQINWRSHCQHVVRCVIALSTVGHLLPPSCPLGCFALLPKVSHGWTTALGLWLALTHFFLYHQAICTRQKLNLKFKQGSLVISVQDIFLCKYLSTIDTKIVK